jgi:hypothetical protein
MEAPMSVAKKRRDADASTEKANEARATDQISPSTATDQMSPSTATDQMSPSTATDQMSPSTATDLNPRTIETEIARIRERESNPYLLGTRTTLFNLVIVIAAGAREADPVSDALDPLLGKRPARIITIEEAERDRTSVFVNGRCFPDERNRGVCFEEIRILAGRDGLGMDMGTWSPLIIRDLPVLLWWLGPLCPFPGFLVQAAQIVDKLIVDSSGCGRFGENPLSVFRELSLVPQRTRGAMKVSDFAWRRASVLRESAARLFNPEPARELLSAVSGVSLTGCSRAGAFLFFLWLASRLGWKAARAGETGMMFMDASGGEIRTVHDGEAPLSEGFKTAFAFSNGREGLEVACADNGCVEVGDLKTAYRFTGNGEALTEEVDGLEQDASLLEAYRVAAAFPADGA